jgi:hypothetical protein
MEAMRTSIMKLSGSCIGAGALLLGAAATAQAAPTPQPRNAVECGSAPGPGTWNSLCVSVVGRGQWVRSVEVSYDSTTAPYFPTTFCDVAAHVFGMYADGTHYSDSGHVGCAQGAADWTFTINPDEDVFQAGSWLCGTVSWGGQTSDPNCVKIEPTL